MIKTKVQIRWGDVDSLGHVYNGIYQHYFDIGKSNFFSSALGMNPNWVETDEGLVTVQTLNNYYSPTLMDENIEVITTVRSIGTKSFTMFQKLVNADTMEVKSDSQSILVCYAPQTQQSYEIKTPMRVLLEKNIEEI